MKFTEAVAKADSLAYKKGLSRVTMTIVEHPKQNTLTIVEKIAYFKDSHEIENKFYSHIKLDKGKVNVNREVDYLKTMATYRTIGEKTPEIEDLDKLGILSDLICRGSVKTDLPTPEEEEGGESEGTPIETSESKEVEVAKPKGKKRGRKPKSKKVKFDKNITSHLRYVADIARKVLGANWKEEQENKDAVKDLIYNNLHQKADVLEGDSDEVLPEFTEFVIEFINKKLDLTGEDDDIYDDL